MTRRAHRRPGFAARAAGLIATAAVSLGALSACGGGETIYSSITPRSDSASDIQFLYKLIFIIALIVFIGVQAGIVYTVLRFRRRSEEGERPPQVHGNKTLEILWTIIPAVILLVIFIPTVRTMYLTEDRVNNTDYVIEVYGKQWWWEVHYKEPDTVANVVTANEIRIPEGRSVVFKLYTNNVIHSFWVPQLHGKMDLIPGHVNELAFTPDSAGVYYGECAEFCGESHTWMRFKVIVVPQAEFDGWISAWNAGPSSAAAAISGDVAAVPQSFGLCLGCHQVNGTNAIVAPAGLVQDPGTEDAPGSARTAGPNLTLFGCRTTLAAGMLENTEANLKLWLQNPGGIKQGNYMASVIKEGLLSDEQVNELTAYLLALTPEGGCPPIIGENADTLGDQFTNPPVASPVAAGSDAAATPEAVASPAA